MWRTDIVLLRWSCDVVGSKAGFEFLRSQKKSSDFAKLQFRLLDAVAGVTNAHARRGAQQKFVRVLVEVVTHCLTTLDRWRSVDMPLRMVCSNLRPSSCM